MTRPANTAAFAASTGKSWPEWLAFLESIGARDLAHKEIARRIVETGAASSWWAQGIAVAYEQHIGRRRPGQRGDGSFEVSVTRTVSAGLDEALALWRRLVEAQDAFDGVAPASPPTSSESGRWRYWRCSLADGSRIVTTLGEKGEGRSTIAVTQEKLAAAADKDRWRAYWKARLAALA